MLFIYTYSKRQKLRSHMFDRRHHMICQLEGSPESGYSPVRIEFEVGGKKNWTKRLL